MRNVLPPISVLITMAAALAWYESGDINPMHLIALATALPIERLIAIALVLLCGLWLVGALVWQAEVVARQGATLARLQDRFGGLHNTVAQAASAQTETDAAVATLADSDPDMTLAAIDQRLKEAERRTTEQHARNEAADMTERVDEIRTRQKSLRQRLGDVIEKRRGIEPIFTELKVRHDQLARELTEIEDAGGGMTIGDRMARFSDDVNRVEGQLKTTQETLAAIVEMKSTLTACEDVLIPLRDPQTGTRGRLSELDQQLRRLGSDLDAIEGGPEPLNERLRAVAAAKHAVEGRIAELTQRAATATALREEIADLGRIRAELAQVLADAESDGHGRSIGEAIDDFNAFADHARGRFDVVEKSLASVKGIKDNLVAYQAALTVLQDPETGLRSVLEDTRCLRDRLVKILDDLELDGDRELAARVSDLVNSRRDAQLRITALSDTFAKMDATRRDVEALFTSLAATLNTYLVPSVGDERSGGQRS